MNVESVMRRAAAAAIRAVSSLRSGTFPSSTFTIPPSPFVSLLSPLPPFRAIFRPVFARDRADSLIFGGMGGPDCC